MSSMEVRNILVADRIKELLAVEKISQYALSKRTGISQSAISNWISGKKEPSIDSLWRLADFFDITVDYLIGRAPF